MRSSRKIFSLPPFKRLIFLFLYTKIISEIKLTERKAYIICLSDKRTVMNKQITRDVTYIGVDDKKIDLFEGQYVVPEGMSYNSYVITDEKIAVFDTVDANFKTEWLDNLSAALKERKPDYLIVQHMEPDHSANIAVFMSEYPEATIVSSKQAFTMMKNYFGKEYEDRRIIVKEGDTLNLGKHELTFVAAPMVHWPEVMVTYDSHDKILFSADGFGKFGAIDAEGDWACEARRYYIGFFQRLFVTLRLLPKQ